MLQERKPSREQVFVRSLPGDFYLLDEVAAMLGCSPRKLHRLKHLDPHLAPSANAYYGEIPMHLYSQDDVVALQAYLADEPRPARGGKPAMWTVEEYRDRQRRDKRTRYWRRRADVLEQRGSAELATVARRRAATLRDELRAQYDRRLAQQRATAGRTGRPRRSAAAAAR